MKVLVINGSPKGAKSNTMKLTEAFIKGMEESGPIEKELLTVSDLTIKPCLGCFHCWKHTPGKCCILDDMEMVIEKILAADVILYSFPLYYFGLPSQLKALIDRQLPMFLPFMERGEESKSESGSHPFRYDLSKKRYLLISTCGFYTSNGNYEAIDAQFTRHLGTDGYEAIYCGQGELFSVPELKKRTDAYLLHVQTAGREFFKGRISNDTKEQLSKLLYPRDVFERMADASWGIGKPDQTGTQEKESPALTFTRQMAALYHKDSWNGKDIVLEMHYTDVKKTYQLIMGKDECQVITQDFLPFTTKILTPLTVFMNISKGEISGETALMNHLYQVEGDFQLLLHWNDYISSSTDTDGTIKNPEKKSSMTLMLLPWFPLWFLGIFDPYLAGIVSILVSGLIPFFYFRYKITFFDVCSGFAGTLLGILALTGAPPLLLVPVSYLLFGLMWSVTVFLKVPLTASYSMYGYGGESALENPLFMKTNRILTAYWGCLYLMTPIWTYLLLRAGERAPLGILNTMLPFLSGIFTRWFQNWYPSHYASSKKKKK